jgi:hypothetical protein
MDLVASVEVPVSVEKLFDYVADLANYSSWLEFVHKVELVGESTETDATWFVELRAKLGVLARSKRLRMTRTLCEHPKLVVFERREQDSRRHSEWIALLGKFVYWRHVRTCTQRSDSNWSRKTYPTIEREVIATG